MAPMNMLELASTLPRVVPAPPLPARDPSDPPLDPPPEAPPAVVLPGEHVVRPAERIGASADGRPLYRAVAGWEPTTAFELGAKGNWIDARVEMPRRAVTPDVDARAELPGARTVDELAAAAAEAPPS